MYVFFSRNDFDLNFPFSGTTNGDSVSNPLNVNDSVEEATNENSVNDQDINNVENVENADLGQDDSTNPYSDNEANPLSAENEDIDEDMEPLEPNMDTNDNPIGGDDVGPPDMDSATEQSQSNMSGSFMEPGSTEPIDRNGNEYSCK